MEKSDRMVYFGILALVFIVYNTLTQKENVVEDSLQSLVLVLVATIIAYLVIRKLKEKGRAELP